MSHKKFDIIISGGGLSGSLMALSLSELTKADGSLLSIAIVEAVAEKQEADTNDLAQFDDRVLALSHGSANYLQKVGAWQFLKQDACKIDAIDISDRGHFAKARLRAQEYGVNALGYVIDMALIGKAQLKALQSKSNVQWFRPDTIKDIVWKVGSVEVALDSGLQLTSDILLACDGAQSFCRKLAKIEVSCDDYQQVALIANVATQKTHHNKAFERFTEHGPIAMLPLMPSQEHLNNIKHKGKGRCSLVWTMSPAEAKRITSLDDEAFKAELEHAFGSWLGSITHVGKRDTYPLVLLQAKQQTYHRMALVGNASHTIHPIAGQGFNLGVRDVECMQQLIAAELSGSSINFSKPDKVGKKDVGSFSLLHNYQVNRTKDQQQVIQLTDSLVTLFANTLPPLVAGRNISLQLLNVISPLKNALVKKTMGY